MLVTLADSFPITQNKLPKLQLINRNKINPQIEFQQTEAILQTKGTGGCYIFWASHPKSILPKFKSFSLSAIFSNTLWAVAKFEPILTVTVASRPA